MGYVMNDNDLFSVLSFLKSAEPLKNTLRSAHTSTGRTESTADHTWRLCLMALIFEDQYQHLDILKLIKLCIIHDLGETIGGDIPAVDQISGMKKSFQERRDMETLVSSLPAALKENILNLWDEYNDVDSEEAQLAKAFDKLETLLQHTQGQNPPNFDYSFNLSYGKQYTNYDELTKKMRFFIDIDTERLALK